MCAPHNCSGAVLTPVFPIVLDRARVKLHPDLHLQLHVFVLQDPVTVQTCTDKWYRQCTCLARPSTCTMELMLHVCNILV